MTSENAHNVPPDVDFESSRSPRKVRVLKQSQSALFGSITYMTILLVFTMFDEDKKSIDSGACRRPWSIL